MEWREREVDAAVVVCDDENMRGIIMIQVASRNASMTRSRPRVKRGKRRMSLSDVSYHLPGNGGETGKGLALLLFPGPPLGKASPFLQFVLERRISHSAICHRCTILALDRVKLQFRLRALASCPKAPLTLQRILYSLPGGGRHGDNWSEDADQSSPLGQVFADV